MKEEFLEIYSPEGKRTGKKESKSNIHLNGFFHATIHVWIFTKKGNILIQKRSKKKRIKPWNMGCFSSRSCGI